MYAYAFCPSFVDFSIIVLLTCRVANSYALREFSMPYTNPFSVMTRLGLVTECVKEILTYQLLELFRLDQRLFPDRLNDAPGPPIELVWQRR
jgi:hypothetical protein